MPKLAAKDWLTRRRGALFQYARLLVPFALVALAVWLRLYSSWADGVTAKVFDFYQRCRPRAYADLGVRFVDIDDDSLAKLGQWPWPRTQVARLIDRLAGAGAAAIALDVVFPEPDRDSPSRVASAWGDSPAARSIRAQLRRLPDNDAVLARSIARAKTVVLGDVLTGEPNDKVPTLKTVFVDGKFRTLDARSRYQTLDKSSRQAVGLPDFPGAVVNLPEFEKAAAGVGMISYLPEPDGIVRRAPMMEYRDDAFFPSLGLEALRTALGQRVIKYFLTPGGLLTSPRLERLQLGDYSIPVDREGRLWVYFTPRGGEPVPAWQVLKPGFDKALVNGTIVFVGTSALGLKDMRATPFDPSAPGVMVHVNAVEDILSGRLLSRPPWTDAAEVGLMLLLGLLMVLVLPYLGAGYAGLLMLAAGGALGAVSWLAFSRRLLLLDPLFPGATMFVSYFASSIIGYLKSESERRQVKGAMSRYMAPALVEQLAKHPEKLKLGGETREMTFHFCDIRGFTTISEQFDPHGLTAFINRFLTPMTDIILEHQGVIDKYMGDCIMAFWNAPLDDPDHARHACRAALAMHARLQALNAELEREAREAGRKFIPIHIGTGLNTGKCVVGNMGSDQRFDYSVLGDDVNLASRLEGQSKTYGVGVVIGPRTREKAPEFAALELDLIKVKGKTVPVRIYTLLGGPELAATPEFQRHLLAHDAMLSAYRARKWDEACERLADCRRGPAALVKLYALYDQRIAAYRQAPPAADWDGAFTATSK